jgi:tRNA (guanine26-N2/guanine27-N2)-dimethyltransferase
MALRLLLGYLHSCAAKHRRYIEPLISCSIDFYIRVFVRVHTSPVEVKKTATKLSLVYCCQGCKSYQLQPMGRVTEDGKKFKCATHTIAPACSQCESHTHLGGPIWNGPLHNKGFVNNLLSAVKSTPDAYGTFKRMEGMFTVISEEIDAPLYYTLRTLTTGVHCNSISLIDMGYVISHSNDFLPLRECTCLNWIAFALFRSALLNAGYQFSISHANPTGVKTDAPLAALWDIIRAHAKRTKVKEAEATSLAFKIMNQPMTIVPDFKYNAAADPPSRKIKVVRFQENPEKNWGPKARAGKRKG